MCNKVGDHEKKKNNLKAWKLISREILIVDADRWETKICVVIELMWRSAHFSFWVLLHHAIKSESRKHAIDSQKFEHKTLKF